MKRVITTIGMSSYPKGKRMNLKLIRKSIMRMGKKWEDGDFMNSKKYSILYSKKGADYQIISPVTMHDLGLDLICKEL